MTERELERLLDTMVDFLGLPDRIVAAEEILRHYTTYPASTVDAARKYLEKEYSKYGD